MRTLVCAALLVAAFDASSSFRCVDSRGKSHFGDTPPPACADVVTQELSPSGNVIRAGGDASESRGGST